MCMIFSVLPGTRLVEIPREAEQLHFVRPIRAKLVKGILGRCRKLERVSMSKSCLQRTPKESLETVRKALEEKGIKMETVSRQGRPISLPLKKMRQALELRKDYQSLREVERVTGISKSTVHYLEKYAQRAKLKNGNKVIYLK